MTSSLMAYDKAKIVDEYIDQAPEVAKAHLREVRSLLQKVVPDAREVIKWGLPVFEENCILFAYSAYRAKDVRDNEERCM